MDGTAAKRRRRNADNDVVSTTTATSDESKTGRPRRGAAAKKTDDAVGDDSTTVADSKDVQLKTTKTAGRGRGKRAATDDADAVASAPPAVDAPKTGRGRRGATKKEDKMDDDDALSGSDADDGPSKTDKKKPAAKTAASADSNGDTASSSVATRKTRGRPKKDEATVVAAADDKKNDDNGKSTISKTSKTTKSEAKPKETIKTITVKGKAPVDSFCILKDTTHVYCSGDEIFDVMLNQTNVQNNNNKFYLIQLLEDDVGKNYTVWQRWGRVGYDGQNSMDRCGGDLEKAKKSFSKKFYDKTGNQWDERHDFEKRSGKYDMVQIDYASKDETKKKVDDDDEDGDTADGVDTKKKKREPPPSKLHQSVQELLNLICDIRAMENAVKEMKYDATKAPLGKLTTTQIKAGYAALKNIETCVEKKDFGKNLTEACNEFYTRIPHYFGMKTPPLIRTLEEIKQKIQLLEALSDIEVAIRTLTAGDDESDKANPVDKHYESMKCQLSTLDHESDSFKLLNNYLTTTHGSTHRLYQMELLDVFECAKDGEDTKFKDLGNRMLLWHGSRLTNWYGILSQGLRIAPPEAPVTGYMFGKGVYFADMSSKSANYCFTTREKNVGLLALCEVSLGKTRALANADYNAGNLPAGFSSTKGVGRTVPDQTGFVTLDDGCVVPCGAPKDIDGRNACLQYNEYIVYDTSQIKMRYLMKVKFVY